LGQSFVSTNTGEGLAEQAVAHGTVVGEPLGKAAISRQQPSVIAAEQNPRGDA